MYPTIDLRRLLIERRTEHRNLTPTQQRRVATLERRAHRTVRIAGDAGVPIAYLGTAETFTKPIAYRGQGTDWIVGPEVEPGNLPLPQDARRRLDALVKVGVDFPIVYTAHEIPPHKVTFDDRHESKALTIREASELVGPAPTASATVAVQQELDGASETVLRVLKGALPVIGAVAAAPFLLAGAAIASVGGGLDPIVFGVDTRVPLRDGEVGAWFVLAQWDW